MSVDEQHLIKRYLAGETVRPLAAEFEITPQTLYNILERNNVQKRVASGAGRAEKLIISCRDGAIVKHAAKELGMSESTATRILRARRESGDILKVPKGRPQIRRLHAEIVKDAVLGVPFPYPTITAEGTAAEIAHLRAFVGHVDEAGSMRPRSLAGVKLCVANFPNRYHARYSGTLSAFDAWHDAKMIKRAVDFQIRHGDPTTPERVLKAVTLLCRTPSVFRPAVAKFLYTRYCPTGGLVWDPCAGFGGRLLGAHAAGVRYVGTDVDIETIESNRRLAAAVGSNAELHLCAAEEFEPPAVDFVFTSPPYFDRERYSSEKTQSWRRYRTFEDWVEKFLCPLTASAWGALSSGGRFALNIANLKKRGVTIPLVERAITAAVSTGFTHSETLLMPLGSIKKKNPTEPVLVFIKTRPRPPD